MAGRTNKTNRRKSAKAQSWIGLLVVAILLVAALAGLELMKSSSDDAGTKPRDEHHPAATVKPVQSRASTIPPPVQKPVTTAKVPVPTVAPRAVIRQGKPGQVAIIIDDMGTSIEELRALMGIGIPLTFSIIPGLAKAREVAAAAHDTGYQVMIHLPMEPEGYPQRRLEKNGLLLAHSNAEIQQRMDSYLKAVPHARGANNHMGSRFTTNREKMRLVLGTLKEHELFFVDSVTTPKSVGLQEARQMGLRSASRQVFMDNVQNVAAIRAQLLQLAAVARKRGAAIGICHPHPSTIKALQQTLPELERSGITFVSAGELAN